MSLLKVPEPRKLSSGTHFIQLRLGGESISVTAPTAKECKDKAALLKAQHKAGQRQAQRIKANPTLGQAIDDYIARRETLSPSTTYGYIRIKNTRFKPYMDRPIRSIKDWQAVINAEAKICGAKTLKNAWGLVCSVLRDNDITPPKVVLPQVVPADKHWLEPEQIEPFIKAMRGQAGEIVALLALHSLRRSEIMALTWDKVDLKKGTIRVEGAAVLDKDKNLVQKKENKNRTSRRTIPIMIPDLKLVLKEIPDKTGTIVKCHPNSTLKQINKVCEANGLPPVGVHGLRHSFASLAYHLGMSETEVMRIGGWSDMQTMRKIYTHLAQADLVKAQNKMAKFYKNANKNANEPKKSSIIKAYET